FSNNRIPPEGAIRFAMGLKVNKTIMTLNMSRNPIQTAGCYGVLKALQNNPDSAMESLDFSGVRPEGEGTHPGRDASPSQGTPSGTQTPDPPDSRTAVQPTAPPQCSLTFTQNSTFSGISSTQAFLSFTIS
uniref:Leucine rich repeat containing 74B n=1 Tax=Scleropages formosus TaxID=113540 RepID=A0A8C9W902_SCLFO